MGISLLILSLALCLSLFINHCLSVEDYQQQGLQLHNNLRALHGSSTMTLDDTLNAQAVTCATDYAQRRVIDGRCSQTTKKGANVAMISAPSPASPTRSITLAVNLWYSENQGYNFDNPDESIGGLAKHLTFTQLIWNKSTKLGCGVKTVKDFTAITCLYDPQGNTVTSDFNLFIQNVKRPIN